MDNNPNPRQYWTKLNTVLLVVIIIGLALIATTKLWVPKFVNYLLERDSKGHFSDYNQTLNKALNN